MLSDEEKQAIEEQYKEGLVNLSNVIEPLINQFKTDYSLDIQQCRLIINYLLMERDFNEDYYDELDKEIEESEQKEKQAYIDGINIADKLCNKKWEDKIKAKIEEITEEKEHYLEINDEYNAQICDCIIEEYKSLLEKE